MSLYPNAQLMHSNRMMEKQLERAYKALELVCKELGEAMPNKPSAGSAEAWLAYAQAVIEQEQRNSNEVAR